MQPILWQWGDFILPAWHAFYVLAALIAYRLLVILGQRYFAHELSARELAWFYLAVYTGGYFGARLWSVMVDQPEVVAWQDKALELLRLGPMTFYGGLLGACLAGFLLALLRRINPATLFDLGLPVGMLALAVGRVGCFLNGDDYGLALNPLPEGALPWWAVAAYDPAQPGVVVWRVPVQLWEAGGALLSAGLAIFCLERQRQQRRPLAAGVLALQLYCVLRFSDEFLRADPRGQVLGGLLSPAQLVSLVLLVGSSVLFVCYEAKRPQIHADDLRPV